MAGYDDSLPRAAAVSSSSVALTSRLQVRLAPGFAEPSRALPRPPGCARLFRPRARWAPLPVPRAARPRAAASLPSPAGPRRPSRPPALGLFTAPIAGGMRGSQTAPRGPGFPGQGGGAPLDPSRRNGDQRRRSEGCDVGWWAVPRAAPRGVPGGEPERAIVAVGGLSQLTPQPWFPN